MDAIIKVGVGGLTVLNARGMGTADPPLVGESYSRKIIVVIVDDSKIDKMRSAITDAACTKLKGDGKIFVSNIENAFDICSGGTDSNVI